MLNFKDFLHEMKNAEKKGLFTKLRNTEIKPGYGYSEAQKKRFQLDLSKLASTVEKIDIPPNPYQTHRVLRSKPMSSLSYNLPISPQQVYKKPFKGKLKKKQIKTTRIQPQNQNIEIKNASQMSYDKLPLYSSFSKTGYINTE